MKNELIIKMGIIFVILLGSLYLTFFVPVKLGLDLKGGVSVTLQAHPTKDATVNGNTMQSLIDVINRRINSLGVSESSVQRSGKDKLIVQLPGVKNKQAAINAIGKMALLQFRLINPDGTLGPVFMSGKDLKQSKLTFDSTGMPAVGVALNAHGTKIFAQITSANIGKQMAIMLDGKRQSSPVLEAPILDGRSIITGLGGIKGVKSLVSLLNAGALPLNVKIVETREIGATLGTNSINKSFKAGFLALILIGLFMLIWYRIPGLVANLSLIIFGFLTFAGMQFFHATFTLPGIAAFILSLGIAVDANVIIFERIKEELRVGNSILKSVEDGTRKTIMTIVDAHTTTLIIAIILFVIGTGEVKGFAITLMIGLIASLFTNVWASSVLLREFVILFKLNDPKLFGIKLKVGKIK